jgi:cyanophycinase
MCRTIVVLLLCLVVLTQCQQLRIPIGGALQVDSPILELFKGKKVAYFTCAGDNPTADAETYKVFFQKRSIQAQWVPVYGSACRSGVSDPTYIHMVEEADSVFFSGGLSGNIQECLFGDSTNGTETPILAAIRKKEIVAGTSAGAMIQPTRDIMITRHTAESYSAVASKQIYYREHGFNLFTHGLVDVHFAERGRQGRLYVLAWATKSRFSYGVDENTALIQYPDGKMKVMGQGGVLVYDATKPMTSFESGIMTHFLTEGDEIDADGKITFANWKKSCSTTKVPPSSKNIFSEWRSRSIEVSQFEKPDFEYKGYVGSAPVVEVLMKKSGATKAMCGDQQGKHHASFSNLFVSISTKSIDQVGFGGNEPGPEIYPYDS